MIKKKKLLIFFIIFLFIIMLVFLLKKNHETKIIESNLKNFTRKIENIVKINNIEITNDSDNGIVYSNNINLQIKNINTNTVSKITINGEDYYSKIDENNTIQYSNFKEGKNDIEIKVLQNDELIAEKNMSIYYIVPYKKQFADKLSYNGISTHIERYSDFDFYPIIKNLGIQYIRNDIFLNKDDKSISTYEKWFKNMEENDINFIALLTTPRTVDGIYGHNNIIDNEEDLKLFINKVNLFNNKYPNIKNWEILNEPNNFFNDQNSIYYYSKLNELLLKQNKDKEILTGSLLTDKGFYWENFANNLFKQNKYIEQISFHHYDFNYELENKYKNEFLKRTENDLLNIENNNGGFIQNSVTEFGQTLTDEMDDNTQVNSIITKETVLNQYNNKFKIIYDLRDDGTNKSKTENNFGILDNDFKPKNSAYVLKKYCENTNGSEYIGQINITDGIEAHLFDKDGKPKIIAWTITGGNIIKINYSGFSAKDLYGNDIENTNGKLEISNSPVYIDNVSNNYFYHAISDSIANGYTEFNTKFADKITKVSGLSTKINDLNNQAVNLKNVSTLDENKANELMKEHFELGKMIMSAYENGKLNIEYVKLSSMLDYINTIGNSYEDLVTVSAKTRITDLSDITNEVNTAKSLAQDNEKFDIVYPNKIYKFAQDLLDTSSYVLGLEEENDIKTGLINSKALHAEYLAEWSQEFSKIYMKDALKDSLNKIIASNQNIKQNYPNVLLNNEINQNYKDLRNSLKEISDNIEKCNSEKINTIYSEQVELVKLIVEKYYSNEIKIDNSSFVTLIKNMIDTLNEYENLYKYYTFEDNISDDDLVNSLNNVINRYNDNRDIDLLTENEIINQLFKTYQNINSIEDETIKYFNKLNIKKTCEIVSNILEGDIKNKAELEYKAISTNADVDLSKTINKDVTITINLPSEKSKITNNNGSNTLRVTENGEYIFNINIREYDYTYKVTINNIDKTLPKLNIKNSGTSISATATDNNLKELKIEKDGKEITYSQGNEITNPGIYQIVAIDKAGNQASSKEIIFGTFKNSNSQEEKYIPIDRTNTKVKDLVEDSNFTIKSEKNGTINSNNKEESNDVNVATGDKLIKNGQEYLLVVKGDITKDGEVGVLDLINLRKQLVSLEDLKDEQAIAADLDGNGEIDVMDLIMERKKIVGIE